MIFSELLTYEMPYVMIGCRTYVSQSAYSWKFYWTKLHQIWDIYSLYGGDLNPGPNSNVSHNFHKGCQHVLANRIQGFNITVGFNFIDQ